MSTAKKALQEESGLGLESLGDLSGLLNTSPVAQGGPLDLQLTLIDEDQNQPRQEDNPGFSNESLKELATTIRQRGVKTPISVRENPDQPGRYIINHGARRTRGSLRADKETIPAFIDNDYSKADQVIENLQRDNLTPREIADYIGRELAAGKKKQGIAKSIGKSPAFVSQHVALLDLPDPIAEAFNTGRTKDVTLINELVKAHKQNSDEVTAWLDDEGQELTRGTVQLLREFVDEKKSGEEEKVESSEEEVNAEYATDQAELNEPTTENPPLVESKPKEKDPDKLKKAIVQVMHDARPARLVLNRRPQSDGLAWVKYEDDGYEFEASLADVQLVALLEG